MVQRMMVGSACATPTLAVCHCLFSLHQIERSDATLRECALMSLLTCVHILTDYRLKSLDLAPLIEGI